MCERFCTTLDCAGISFIPDDTLDQLPLPSHLGSTRVGGIDISKPRTRAVLTAVIALSAAPRGFTAADLAAKVSTMTGQAGYTTRQAPCDLRKLRDKDLAVKPGRTRRYQIPPQAARSITALIVLRDHVTAPLLGESASGAAIASPPP